MSRKRHRRTDRHKGKDIDWFDHQVKIIKEHAPTFEDEEEHVAKAARAAIKIIEKSERRDKPINR